VSLARFHATLLSAVREAQAAEPPAGDARPEPAEAQLLRRVVRGELTAEEALRRLGEWA
jgi:hypothetical protein